MTGNCDSGQLGGNRGILKNSCLSTMNRASVPILCSTSQSLALAHSLSCGTCLPVNFFLPLLASIQVTGSKSIIETQVALLSAVTLDTKRKIIKSRRS